MNILIFGPNGSGKGTQGAVIERRFSIPHIESGMIFRANITKMTDLGRRAQEYIDHGELVPDGITVPMILNRLHEEDCRGGWLLDGFPRTLAQATALTGSLAKSALGVDLVIEIVLDRIVAKQRIMGRRLCARDNNHPNNIFIDAIKPALRDGRLVCRVCGCDRLTTRIDDQDEEAIDRRHAIYYDAQTGTLAAVHHCRAAAPYLAIDGTPAVESVSRKLLAGIESLLSAPARR